MHECMSVADWIRAWGDPDVEGRQLASCPTCSEHRGDYRAWLEAVQMCPECREALDEAPIKPEQVVNCPRCMDSFEKLHEILEELEHFDPAVASEALRAEELFRQLSRLPASEQLARVTDDIRFHQWGLAQRYLHAAQEIWRDDPTMANERATVAVTLAGLVDPATYNPRWVADLRAKAYAYLANTFRILGEFRQAEREFLVAETYLRRGVGGGLFRARVFSLKASLLVDQSRFVEAGALLDVVEDAYSRGGEPTDLARTELQRAMVLAGQERYLEAAEECGKAASQLHPVRDLELHFIARKNAILFLLRGDRVEQARGLLDALPPAQGPALALKLKWIEAELLRAEGRLPEAMDAFAEARRGFREEGRFYYMAIVALDEALTAFEMGDLTEVGAMVEEASILLVKAAARHEAIAVVGILMSAIERGTLTTAALLAVRKRVEALKPS
jgi:tetratricopeptide (TPR) repeat protein